jgi:hypothetical protein
MNSEKLLVIFAELYKLIKELKEAIKAANKLADLNADSKNVTEIINQFSKLKETTDQKIIQINTVSRAFNKHSLINTAAASIAAIIFGFAAGVAIGSLTFAKYLSDDVLKNQTESIAKIQLVVEHEKQQFESCYVATKKGVQFYSDGVTFPLSSSLLQDDAHGHALYMY